MLVLAALANGREVIVSRAELVEIGGGFRVPDIMRQSGATLREVGTTNRTRVNDYAAAISGRTALILRVHPSNFRIEGFTERPDPTALVAMAHRFEVPVVEDLGSGNVLGPALGAAAEDVAAAGRAIREEPSVADSLTAGYDVVCVSGDKLLGGPQAGLVLGRARLLDQIRTHPLMRAVRVDKLTYAALEATLVEHITGRAREHVPVARMLALPRAAIEARARTVADRLAACQGLVCRLIEATSTVGGGSAPGSTLPTVLLAVEGRHLSADTIDGRLRAGSPPVVARIENGCVVFDLRTVMPEDDDTLAEAIRHAAASR
jgi:L-seryl-tRNA(Ser) seleniumtransferase